MAGNKNEEVEALEALRDSSAQLVQYLDNINAKLLQMNEQNEMSLRVLENWSSVIAISKTVIGILMCTLWKSEVEANAADGWDKAVIALLWIHNAACISLTNSFVLLAGFHTYLLCVGMGTYDFILANGSDGLCTRMLKCNCLRRKTTKNRSHVQHGDANDTKNAKGVATRRRRGSPPPAVIFPADLSSIRSQTSLDRAVATAVLELSKCSDSTSREIVNSSGSSSNPTEAAAQPNMVLSMGVNESEGIFEDVDLNSPAKPKKSSGAVVAPATMDS
ncbi:uncharacterized protein KRP23_522 [Phytophthora ramorum]|nr:hypothetical protein KRP23_522 [Phytophthora ramorum]